MSFFEALIFFLYPSETDSDTRKKNYSSSSSIVLLSITFIKFNSSQFVYFFATTWIWWFYGSGWFPASLLCFQLGLPYASADGIFSMSEDATGQRLGSSVLTLMGTGCRRQSTRLTSPLQENQFLITLFKTFLSISYSSKLNLCKHERKFH